MENYWHLFIFLAGFALIALAAKQVGGFFFKAKLPLISGFLFTGIIAGPFVLGLIPKEAVANLRFVDEFALAFIAFAAGNELYLKELKSRFNSIKWVTTGLVFSTFFLGSTAFFLLSGFIPFMQNMPGTHRMAVSILAGAILVARSPSSAIAVVNELRAKGPFTKTVLGVTVIMDLVVITLFAVNSSIADALLTDLNFDFRFILLLGAELTIALAVGYLLSRLLQFILARPVKRNIKAVMVLLAGYGVFFLSDLIRNISRDQFGFDVLLEPLLICMIGSFLTTNYSNYRMELLKILYDVGPPIYIAFFTLTGASLALDILTRTWPIALGLFFVRLFAIFIGSFTGGIVAGDPLEHNRIGWMGYITQAGVGLGLAKEVGVQFPEWGAAFATIIISIIVVNQIVGPPLFKWAIHLAGEAHSKAEPAEYDGIRDAVIFGLEGQSLALARQLRAHGWEVKIATTETGDTEEMENNTGIPIFPVAGLDLESMNKLGAGQAEAIVAMLSDEENLRICELAYENFGTQNLVVRLNEQSNLNHFRALGALIVEPTTAIVNLLDQFVRSPSAATLLLGMEKNQDVIEIEVRNTDLQGMPIRDLRLPVDVLLLSIRRNQQMLLSHGYTRLEVGDLVTAVGSPESLEQILLHFDTNREYELLHLVERVTPAELTTRSLSAEVKEMIREKDEAPENRFDRLIEESIVMDIDRPVSLEEFFTIAAGTLSSMVNEKSEVIFNLLIKREKESSTAITRGLAIPHIIIDGEKTFRMLLVRCREGISFSDSAPMVQAVFVLAGTKDERDFHLRALSIIAEIVQDAQFEKRWLRARNKNALREVVLSRKRKRRS